MRSPELLHCLVGSPGELQSDMHTTLFVIGLVPGVKGNTGAGGITDNAHQLVPAHECVSFHDVGAVVAVLSSEATLEITHIPFTAPGHLRDGAAAAELVDEIVQWVVFESDLLHTAQQRLASCFGGVVLAVSSAATTITLIVARIAVVQH